MTIQRGIRVAVIVGAAVAVGFLFVARRHRWERGWEQSTVGDVVPESAERRDELIDTAIDGSFPASDPPSYWGRELG